ncbi:hypothetical protein Ancab_033752 [Ancistrocladus abbreviatus]
MFIYGGGEESYPSSRGQTMERERDLITMGCSPTHSVCSKPLRRCPVKLKTKRASFSRKQKKAKQRGSSTKTSKQDNEQGGMKAGSVKAGKVKAGKAQISGTSLSDNNIENMNRLFLLKLDNVSAEKTWEIGWYNWANVQGYSSFRCRMLGIRGWTSFFYRVLCSAYNGSS